MGNNCSGQEPRSAPIIEKRFAREAKAEWSDWEERHRRKSRKVAESEWATSESIHCEMRRFAREIEEWSVLGNRDIDGKTREVAGELLGK